MNTYINVYSYEEFIACIEKLQKQGRIKKEWRESDSLGYHQELKRKGFQSCVAYIDTVPDSIYTYHYELSGSWQVTLDPTKERIIESKDFLNEGITHNIYKALEELEQAITKKNNNELDRGK